MRIGSKIKEARSMRGLTQSDLVKQSGVSRTSIQLYEADKGNITLENLNKIARALDINMAYFLSDYLSLSPSKENVVKSSLSQNKSVVKSNSAPPNLKQENIPKHCVNVASI